MRIGQGFDVHAFSEGTSLRLGGVDIPFERGIDAHSDGDVVLHALSDALLGAAGLGDMGCHFPSSDARWEDADSRDMLRSVMAMIRAEGLVVQNADITVICEAPPIAPHSEKMKQHIAEDLAVKPGRISIKATTTDGLGFAGRGEGIAAGAVVLLVESD